MGSFINSPRETTSSASREEMKEDIQAQPSRQPVTEEHDWNTYEDMLKAAFQGLIKCKNKQDSELQSCRESLKTFSKDKANQSESSAENAFSSNPPSKLEWTYKMFYEHERKNAIDFMTEGKGKVKYIEMEAKLIACKIFQESFVAAESLKENCIDGISWILGSLPSIGAQYSQYTKSDKSGVASFSFAIDTRHEDRKKSQEDQTNILNQISRNCLKVIMKETAATCNIDALVQKTTNALEKHPEIKQLLGEDSMKKYVKECCEYAWKLVCQTTSYLIQGTLRQSEVFDEEVHLACNKSATTNPGSGIIRHVVWPGLIEKESSGRVVRVIHKTKFILEEIDRL